MTAEPYTPEELAELRMGASEGLAGKSLSRALATIDAVAAERDQALARGAAHREAAGALVDALTGPNANIMGCSGCGRLATRIARGEREREHACCDHCGPDLGVCDLPVGAALRRLRALLGAKP